MGDSGASGVVGGIAIIAIFFLAFILGISFFAARQRTVRIVIGVLLLPFLVGAGLLAFVIIKAEIEKNAYYRQDEQRRIKREQEQIGR